MRKYIITLKGNIPKIKSAEPLSIKYSDSYYGYDKIEFTGTEEEFSIEYERLTKQGLKIIGIDY